MLGHYGWLMTFEEIDHPDVGKTGGRVYVHKRDVVKGALLSQGDTVSFYLYVDDQGLGAERCQLKHCASSDLGYGMDDDEFVPAETGFSQPEVSNLRADADDFVPGGACAAPGFNACAAEFVPAAPTVSAPGFNAFAAEFVPAAPTVSNGFNAQASEFIPSECKIVEAPTTSISSCFNVQASEFVPSECNTVGADVQDAGLGFSGVAASNPNVLSINPAFLSDDESDDESGILSSDDFAGFDGDKESDESDKESSCSENELQESIIGDKENTFSDKENSQHDTDVEWSSDLEAVVLHAPLKSPRASSDEDSTSVGATDFEAESAMRSAVKSPPGLSLPKGLRPPPGLEHLVLAH